MFPYIFTPAVFIQSHRKAEGGDRRQRPAVRRVFLLQDQGLRNSRLQQVRIDLPKQSYIKDIWQIIVNNY